MKYRNQQKKHVYFTSSIKNPTDGDLKQLHVIDLLRIKIWLDNHKVENYKINIETGEVDVYGDVDLSKHNLYDVHDDENLNRYNTSDFCVKFRNVYGDFDCSNNHITSLDNVPDWIGGDFDCSNIKLNFLGDKSLYVGGNLYCFKNSILTSLAKKVVTIAKDSRLDLQTPVFETIKNIVVKGAVCYTHPKEFLDSKENKKKLEVLKFHLVDMVKHKQMPRYLYKYCSLKKLSDQDPKNKINIYTHSIITANELYFNSPANFNDPYDCNISKIDTPSVNNRDFGKDLSKDKINEIIKVTTINPEYIKTAIKNYMDKIGICCFSTVCDSILMWSHYADYHKGICLKFDILKDPNFFLNTVSVHYSHLLPYFDFKSYKNRIPEEILRTKFIDWSYENEVRIFKDKKEIKNNKKPTDKDENQSRIFKFKDKALVEIIFGEKTSKEDVEFVKNLCQNSPKKHVKFSQMKLKQDVCYGLEKEYLEDSTEVKNEI